MASLVLKISCVILLLTCGSHACGSRGHSPICSPSRSPMCSPSRSPVCSPSRDRSSTQCPQYWTRVGNYCYRYFGSGRRWHDAHTVCRNAGAHLPSIHSRTEEVALYQLWKGLAEDPTRADDAYWLGLRDTYREGRFTWTDGTWTDYTNWRSGEPNNHNGGEDCVEVQNIGNNDEERMKWNDQPCDNSLSFFCRLRL